MSSITFPAISAMVSRNADPDQQGESLGGLSKGRVCPSTFEFSALVVEGWAGASVALVVLTRLSLTKAGVLGENSGVVHIGVQCWLSEVERRLLLNGLPASWLDPESSDLAALNPSSVGNCCSMCSFYSPK